MHIGASLLDAPMITLGQLIGQSGYLMVISSRVGSAA